MKWRFFILSVIGLISSNNLMSQNQSESLPFSQLSAYPEAYTANTVAARMIESLGFRYYWSSNELREEDLKFKASEDTRSIKETLVHIYDLSVMIRNSAEKRINDRQDHSSMNYEELRKTTLTNLKQAVDILKEDEDLEAYDIKFESSSFPFWNQINGPISDAIWHCGQLVILRRVSGNPINSKVNQFTGTVRD